MGLVSLNVIFSANIIFKVLLQSVQFTMMHDQRIDHCHSVDSKPKNNDMDSRRYTTVKRYAKDIGKIKRSLNSVDCKLIMT